LWFADFIQVIECDLSPGRAQRGKYVPGLKILLKLVLTYFAAVAWDWSSHLLVGGLVRLIAGICLQGETKEALRNFSGDFQSSIWLRCAWQL